MADSPKVETRSIEASKDPRVSSPGAMINIGETLHTGKVSNTYTDRYLSLGQGSSQQHRLLCSATTHMQARRTRCAGRCGYAQMLIYIIHAGAFDYAVARVGSQRKMDDSDSETRSCE